MKALNNTFLIRFAVAIILLVHTNILGIFNNEINDFGNLFLNKIGFSPLGVPIAWAVKLSHLVGAFCLMFGKHVKWASIINILILIVGIIFIHFKQGWFAVDNGVEFSFLLIFSLLTIMFPNGLKKEVVNP